MKRLTRSLFVIFFVVLFSACGGCGGGGGGGGSATAPPPATYTVSGTVTGLTGTGLVLRNNGGSDLAISSDGIFTFATAVANGNLYAVTVAAQPTPLQPTDPTQSCSVTNASGTVTSGNIIDVLVTCNNVFTSLQIDTGSSTTCVRLDNNQIKCWGYNSLGQLGLGDSEYRGNDPDEMGNFLPPIALGAQRTVLQVASGNRHSCALLDNGRIKCWGDNFSGQLGLGDVLARGNEPNEMGQALPTVDLGSGRTAVQIAAGFHHNCALLDNGGVKCWGGNDTGQLGQDNNFNKGDGPNEMGDSLLEIVLGAFGAVTQITAGGFHTCALFDSGKVQCWGYNSNGQLGLGDSDNRGDAAGEMANLPEVELGTGRSATLISAGDNHTCALLDNGRIKCWGDNSSGQLGLGEPTVNDRGDDLNEMGDDLPVVALGASVFVDPITGIPRSIPRIALQISAGGSHTCALLGGGDVKCWGLNTSGQLGLGDMGMRGIDPSEMGNALPTVDLGSGRVASQITAGTGYTTGTGHSCARLTNGDVKCWGANDFGQLGLGDAVSHGDGANEMGDNLPVVDLGAP